MHSPWGPRQPDPYLASTIGIYGVALRKDARSPFQPPDELHPAKPKDAAAEPDAAKEEKGRDDKGKEEKGKKDAKDDKEKKAPPRVEIDLDGLASRLFQVPVPAGDYEALNAGEDRLFWLATDPGIDDDTSALQSLAIEPPEKPGKGEVKTVAGDIQGYDLSDDGKKLLIRKGDDLAVLDASEEPPGDDGAAAKALEKGKIDLAGWTFPLSPREQWQQMFREAWRLERDYFYDPKMHGVDWPAMYEKYRPLSLRVTSRGELDDLLAQMVSELSALHTFVYGGEHRKGADEVEVASLGASLSRDEAAGGWRVEHVYRSDPDLPNASPAPC